MDVHSNLIFTKVGGRVEQIIEKILSSYSLPEDQDAIILVKPNLNNDMNALLGGTTDLRIIAAVLKYLKMKYTNVVLGDGPNIGCYHDRIDVFHRLRLDKLARRYDVEIVDFNKATKSEIRLGSQRAWVASICLERDFMINLPKIKTHSEFAFSCCLKNMVGCLSGLSKRKAHTDMPTYLLELNEIIHPDLHIVDGLIGMEGKGPSAGTPKMLDRIIAGTDPLYLDLYCCKTVGLNWWVVPYLRKAVESQRETLSKVMNMPEDNVINDFKKAPNNPIINLLLSNTFVLTRHNRWLDPIFSRNTMTKLLCCLGVRQENFRMEDAEIGKIMIDDEKCTHCGKCLNYCPIGIPIDKTSTIEDCLKCLYCYMVCPEQAISLEGNLGFLEPYFVRTKKLWQAF
jgi:uncharacterized protein (DUF362 family)/Pyruvate/2-oxoacid:ferredoxin oxidoreductase delta subunit